MRTTVEPPALPRKEDQAVCHALQPLIQANLDAHEGFRQAAEKAWDSELRAAFSERAMERESFAHELQDQQHFHGQRRADEEISVAGALHRAWVGLKTALTSQDDQVLVEESAKAEASAADCYRAALEAETPLPAPLRARLVSQSLAVRDSCAELQKWADSRRYLRID